MDSPKGTMYEAVRMNPKLQPRTQVVRYARNMERLSREDAGSKNRQSMRQAIWGTGYSQQGHSVGLLKSIGAYII